MLYFLYFLVGGIITALPILTLINKGMQMKNRKEDTFHTVLQNTVFGVVGILLFTMLAFLLTSWFKPSIFCHERPRCLCYLANIFCRCLLNREKELSIR